MKTTLLTKRGTHGLGLFTTIPFKKGELIIEYTGDKLTTDQANRRGGQYLFELNDDWVIDGKDRVNQARYINHSCRPNCYPEIDEAEEHILIYAKRVIKIGEELTYDYGKEFWETHVKSKGCCCTKCTEERSKVTTQ